MRSGVSLAVDQNASTDLSEQVTDLKIPVYFLHGIYD